MLFNLPAVSSEGVIESLSSHKEQTRCAGPEKQNAPSFGGGSPNVEVFCALQYTSVFVGF